MYVLKPSLACKLIYNNKDASVLRREFVLVRMDPAIMEDRERNNQNSNEMKMTHILLFLLFYYRILSR